MRPLLFLTLLLNCATVFGQEKVLVLPGKTPEQVARHSNRRMTGDSSGTYQLQGQIQPGISQLRVSQNRLRQRIQMPKRDQAAMPMLIFFSAALGAILFMSLFTVAQYLLNRDATYGWYGTCLAIASIWIWQAINFWYNRGQEISNPSMFSLYMLLLWYGTFITYLGFLGCLLEISQRQPRLERWRRYFFRFLPVLMVASITELFILGSLQVYLAIGFLNYLGIVILGSQMIRSHHPLKPYVVVGSILLLSANISPFLFNYIDREMIDQLRRVPVTIVRFSFFLYSETPDKVSRMPLLHLVTSRLQKPLLCMTVSRLLEMLCYSLALGRYSYLNKQEKIQTQQQLIQQLEENQQLQQTHTSELQRQLAQRTTEVLTQAHELEDQRVNQLRSDFERRAAEAEMAGLRSQMNPHFIFNCLNSIKLYAIENDSEKASDYLTKFSRLIRMVLENSRSERVMLQNELDMLQLYADLEIMRFKQKLSFFIDLDPGIDAGFVEIPPLLLQPYVENAIWHGLMHKPEGGSVHVRATQPQENLLQLTITDDGVGRNRAAKLKSKSASHQKSFGLKVTSERIALVNQLYQTHTQVTINDLVDTEDQPAGTEVVLQIQI